MNHRPDIDGLRAVAVLPVVAYHAQLYRFSGGFVGVDIFFVISGYLIGSIILSDMATGRFSILTFYERRVRRIAPALFVVLLATCVLAYRYLLPVELAGFAKSLLSTVFFASNFYFWDTTGYFTAPAETHFLLHTWSLAVEEQFYIFLPVFLLLGHRFFPHRMRVVVTLIALFSLGISAVGVYRAPEASFYLAPTRAWELLLGVLIALEVFPTLQSPLARNAAAGLGMGLIFWAVFYFSKATPFPGLAALVPCAGAALVILAGQSGSSLVGRVLSVRPVVFIGLISYSLYLWHWPVIVFQRMSTLPVDGFSPKDIKVGIILTSIVLAALSWKFVELPFRTGRRRMSRQTLFRVALAGAACLIVAGIGILASGGLPFRYSAPAREAGAYLDYAPGDYFRDGSCFISPPDGFDRFDDARCLSQTPGRKNYLLVGDSHAAHLWYGLSTTLEGVNIMQATVAGCRPSLEQPPGATEACLSLMRHVFVDYLPNHPVDKLLVASNWYEEDLPRLAHTLEWATQRNIPVVLFGPIVQYNDALPRLLANAIRAKDPTIPDRHRLDQQRLEVELAGLAERMDVKYISLHKALCSARTCEEFAGDGSPLQFDYGHLTERGSVLVAQRVVDIAGLP